MISFSETPEEEIVGYCLEEPAYSLGKVEPEWFPDPRHQAIISAAKALFALGAPVSAVTVFRRLREDQIADMVGGAPYLGHLITCASCQHAFDYLLKQLRAEAEVRVYGHLALELKQAPERGKELLANVESKMPRAEAEPTISETVLRIVDKLERNLETPGALIGFSSGYQFLDRLTGGMQPGQLWIIAARPGIGKTTMLLNMMLRIMERCGLISLEMNQEELVQRLWFCEARVPLSSGRIGLTRDEMPRIAHARIRLEKKAILISDKLGNALSDVAIEARSLKNRGMQVLFIDYLQLMRSEVSKSDNRVAEMTYVSNGLKRLARELQMPIVCACQLNREVSKSAAKPELHHLRDTGAIEQDADLVVMLHQQAENDKKLDVLVRKNRSGPTDSCTMRFDKTMALIEPDIV